MTKGRASEGVGVGGGGGLCIAKGGRFIAVPLYVNHGTLASPHIL